MRRVHDAAELDRAIRSARACAAELLAALDLGRASQPALEALSSKALAAVGHLRDAAARLSE
jgi:hypothetical protein